jgi:cellulose synthase/poly-beta-1,6-N-acetylglucosamine synthase-like glycosyltransferase
VFSGFRNKEFEDYIKENNGYYLTYVPDAKAFTDAPENLSILIK